MKLTRLYIASPYTAFENKELAVVTTLETAEDIIKTYGPDVFEFNLPLLSHYWDMYFGHNYEFWMGQCLNKVRYSTDVVFRIVGKSDGADREVKLAEELSIPVVYTIEELGNHV